MYVRKTPPNPPQNTPFPALNLKVSKMNFSLGKMNPNWAKCLKERQNVSRSGLKKNSSGSPAEDHHDDRALVGPYRTLRHGASDSNVLVTVTVLGPGRGPPRRALRRAR